MSKSQTAGIKPNNSFTLPTTESAILLKCVGGDGTLTRAIASIAKGNPTVVTFSAAMPTYPFLTGQRVKASSIVVTGGTATSALNNTYPKILWADVPGKRIALDIDTGSDNWTAFTSGNISSAHLADQFNTLSGDEMLVTGTLTSIWSAQDRGYLPAAGAGLGGSIAANSTNSFFDMPSTGRVAFSFSVSPAAVAPASEQYFTLNRDGDTGNNSANGAIYIGYYGASSFPTLRYLPRTTPSSGTITSGIAVGIASGSAALTLNVPNICQWIIDFDTQVIYAFRDGAYTGQVAINQAGIIGTGNPLRGQGAVFFGGLNASGTIQNKLNGVATPSTTAIKDCLIWKSSKSLTDMIRIITRFGRTGEFPVYML